jgi:hypothetical protein
MRTKCDADFSPLKRIADGKEKPLAVSTPAPIKLQSECKKLRRYNHTRGY